MQIKEGGIVPIIKWAGGKRQLIPEIAKYVPETFFSYYEPFVGGGALLFHLLPQKAYINDLNEELINLYIVIRDKVELLIEDLKKHKNTAEYFYRIRNLDRDSNVYNHLSDVQKASRVLYLNKVCYNGLYRVNKKGQFNTPFGRYKDPKFVNEKLLRKMCHYFNKASITITSLDFEQAVEGADKNSFVYFDPPYDPLSESSSFTSYEKDGFGKTEQIRLRNLCDRLDEIGVKFLLSNSKTDLIIDLYKDYKTIFIQANRAINSKATGRSKIEEVLVRNYE